MRILTLDEAARALGVAADTLRRWTWEGRIEAIRLGPRRHRVFDAEIIERVAAERRKKAWRSGGRQT